MSTNIPTNTTESPTKLPINDNKQERGDHKVITQSTELKDKLNELNLNDLAIELKNLKFTYNKSKTGYLLNDINLTFPRSAIYGFIGPSGCGKTTIIRLIVGRLKPNDGTITINGKPMTDPLNKIPGVGIGYMPQDYSLYEEFTIMETFNYYSKIYGLTESYKNKRIKFLIKFLELSDPNGLIRDLSGGQKRCTSLAIAIIHSPPLLILDEPTVGVDPILRERVWQHLVYLSSVEKTSILITTYNIEECMRAHIISLMRSGKLLVENSPSTLLKHFKTDTLEDVFLQVCKFEEQPNSPASMPPTIAQVKATKPMKTTVDNKNNINAIIAKSESKFTKRFQALVHKNLMRLWRQKFLSFVIIILPMIIISLFCICIGKMPSRIKIAVFNEESKDGLSDKFLNKIDKQILNLKLYSSTQQAIETVRNGKTFGALLIPKNFSIALKTRITAKGLVVSDQTLSDSTIKFMGDLTELIIYQTVFKALLEAEITFEIQMISDLGKQSNVSQKPNFRAIMPIIEFVDPPIYGSMKPSMRNFAAPGFIILIIYSLSMTLTALNVVAERKLGLLDRTLIAGIKSSEILMAEICVQQIVLFLQIILLFIALFLIFHIKNDGSVILVFIMTILQGICGMTFGLFISGMRNSEDQTLFLCIGCVVPYLVISGILWPLEGMHFILQILSKLTPQTLPIQSLRNIMLKGWDFSYTLVWIGFISTIFWIIVFAVLATIFSSFK